MMARRGWERFWASAQGGHDGDVPGMGDLKPTGRNWKFER